tara:strand:- start:406 stop:1002 length:597 start_codon:yes stop_codon:yes gene_type:complete
MQLDIRYAKRIDLTYVDHLQKKNAEDLSFYPRQVFEREAEKNRILLALVNNQHAGYLYHGSFNSNDLRIHQACIEYDLRGNWYGAGLVNTLEDMSKINFKNGISLRCGSDIAANRFWKLMGFKCIDIQEGGIRRMRDINVWYKELVPDLFGFDSLEPSKKEKDASIWRNRKKDKKQSRMLRGKALLDYRKIIIEEQEE